MQFAFAIGEREAHRVEFSFNQFWGNLAIRVDGKVAQRDFRIASFNLVKRYELTVGTEERHVVAIEHERKRALGGLRPQKYRVYVDDKLIQQHEGF